MYIDNDDFNVWMQKLYAKLEEIGKDVRILRNADKVQHIPVLYTLAYQEVFHIE